MSGPENKTVAEAEKPPQPHRFKPGQSGNPGGRPKALVEVTRLAREYTETAIRALADIAVNGKSESARVQANTALLDRAWGKPTQPIGDGEGGPALVVQVVRFGE